MFDNYCQTDPLLNHKIIPLLVGRRILWNNKNELRRSLGNMKPPPMASLTTYEKIGFHPV
ncbi:hypothetical protein NQ317_006916 [Molorchus minor]|uniref:Uncharacterized protein n=1 Tax=Molorchus minor TaxID=1323400 RepID=A0ABQ9IY83_9CUCU|nr:hypothetical protein NQ317_006916 [Molorchus minor]